MHIAHKAASSPAPCCTVTTTPFPPPSVSECEAHSCMFALRALRLRRLQKATCKRPAAKGQLHNASCKRPSAKGQLQKASCKRPAARGQLQKARVWKHIPHANLLKGYELCGQVQVVLGGTQV